MLIYNLRIKYKIRAIKNLIIGLIVIIIVNLLLSQYLFKQLRYFHMPETVPFIFYLVINIIIISNLALRLWPHIVFCEDCGNVLGNELKYRKPCNLCRSNRVLLRPPLVGKTYKITHQKGNP